MFNLDISGTFNNSWHTGILLSMIKNKVPPYLYFLIKSLLHNRTVNIRYAGAVFSGIALAGCPQGAVLSPILWCFLQEEIILVMRNYLRTHRWYLRLHRIRYFLANFTDDSTVLLIGPPNSLNAISRNMLSREAGLFINHLTANCKHFLVTFAGDKTNALHFFRKYESVTDYPIILTPTTALSTIPDPEDNSIRVLGLWIDNKLLWNPHIERQAAKCQALLFALRGAYGSSHGLSGKLLKVVFQGLISACLFYAAEIWGYSLLGQGNLTRARKVDVVLNRAARMICKSSKTSSNIASRALAGIPPTDLLVPQGPNPDGESLTWTW